MDNGNNLPDNGLVNLCCRAAYEASRSWCLSIGDDTHEPYDNLSTAEKAPIRESVIGILQGNIPEQAHEDWRRRKIADGWSWGSEKDDVRKTHPALLPYEELDLEQRVKNDIWCGVTQLMQKIYWTSPQ